MADVSDVMDTLVTLAANAVYPNGTSQPSVSGHDVIVYAGWCIASRLDDDLTALKTHVSVYARPEESVMPRYNPEWQTVAINAPTLTLDIVGNTVTIGGFVVTHQNVTLIVNAKSYSYAVQTGDTLTTIAHSLALLINADTTATNADNVVIIPNAYQIVGRIGVTGISMRELRRQERLFQIVVWAANPELRNSVSKAIDASLTDKKNILLPDGSYGRMNYKGSPITDDLQKDRIFRRDLMYTVEYATTEQRQDTTVTTTQTSILDAAAVKVFMVNL